MTRYKATAQGQIPFTADEEAEWDAMEAAQKARELIPVVPDEITMRQARLVLLGAGLLAKINDAIAKLPEPLKSAATIEWEYSGTVKRRNGFVEQLAPVLGLTSEQLDNLFIQGVKL